MLQSKLKSTGLSLLESTAECRAAEKGTGTQFWRQCGPCGAPCTGVPVPAWSWKSRALQQGLSLEKTADF